MAKKIEAQEPDDTSIEAFIKKSHKISGIRRKSNWQLEAYQWRNPEDERIYNLFKRHREIVSVVLKSDRLQEPWTIHHGLFHQIEPSAGVYRTGVPGSLIGKCPLSEVVPSLMKEWYEKADELITQSGDMKEKKLISCIEELRFEFLCIHPFQDGNGRTARLIENAVRLLVGLPWRIFGYKESYREAERLHNYREKVFLPNRPKKYFRPKH